MATIIRALAAAGCVVGLSVAEPADVAAQETLNGSSASLERIRNDLQEPPSARIKFDRPLQLPVAVFKTSVERRRFTLTLEEELHKEFDLTLLQRQSAEWSSKCCGFNLLSIPAGVKKALHDRKVNRIQQQVERELAAVVDAARKQ